MSVKKIAIVTGGGSGIGMATSKRLAKEHSVAVVYSRSREGAEAVVRDICQHGGNAIAIRADVAIERDVQELFRLIKDKFGRVDVVVNNAGIGYLRSVVETPMEDYDRIFGVNARGTFMMCREAARHLEDSGHIINISTGATKSNMPGQALYTASKLAIEGFSKVLAKELGHRGISVNIVSPGMTDTPMLEGGDAEALRRYGAKASVMGRCGQPEDIADAIAAIVSSDFRWVTGQNISVCGGMNIY